tara:strand:- start:1982 stop:2644 length:663 start_codon:yes stop_codon:yes gene_type:complete
MKQLNFISSLHKSTKRNYIERMVNKKVECIKVAKKYDFHYWDGKRKYGYGGYKFIEGRWSKVAKKIIRFYKLNNKSRLLDVGCGKGYLLYEIKKILPNIRISGFDISAYAIKNSKKEIKKYLFKHDVKNKFPFKRNTFDLVISLGCLHNLKIYDLENSLHEISRVGKNQYIMVESFRNDRELFNLQCWALTAESFLHVSEWKWFFKKIRYKGEYEFIFFE